jgi:multisubunit Na+/H+ antiporter MnhC subunit
MSNGVCVGYAGGTPASDSSASTSSSSTGTMPHGFVVGAVVAGLAVVAVSCAVCVWRRAGRRNALAPAGGYYALSDGVQ